MTFRLGLNALQNTPQAKAEAARGCKYFLIMNDFQGAAELKQAAPNAIVMARRFFNHGVLPSVDQIIFGLEGANHGPLVYIALNEADQIGQGGNDLVRRAELDIAVAQRIKAINPNAIYAAGTFSMGTPDFTNGADNDIIRRIYAPAYNSGLLAFDMHLYSPNMAHIDQPGEWQWFERRWEFLFTRCGFDPAVRAIYCSECGLDEGGVGGFPAHAASQDYFRNWSRKYIALQNAPMLINGRSYPSPIQGGAIFQLGGNGDPRWQGYDVSSYLPVLREFYNQVPVNTVTPSVTVTPTASSTPRPTLTRTPSATRLPAENPTITPIPSSTFTPTPTRTPSPTLTPSPTRTPRGRWRRLFLPFLRRPRR
jgi:hypothetical protein